MNGFKGVYFEDRDGSKGNDSRDAITFKGEVDRVYQHAKNEMAVYEDGSFVEIEKEGADDVGKSVFL